MKKIVLIISTGLCLSMALPAFSYEGDMTCLWAVARRLAPRTPLHSGTPVRDIHFYFLRYVKKYYLQNPQKCRPFNSKAAGELLNRCEEVDLGCAYRAIRDSRKAK